jgi:3-isopropylmalate dehydratase small subunit
MVGRDAAADVRQTPGMRGPGAALCASTSALPPPVRLRFEGRVLFLVDDAELMRRQLGDGEDLELTTSAAKLRDQISTDEITPAYICYYFDETLGEFPYLGLRAGGEFPVARGLVKQGGFVCSVSGKRRGKGSSREQSPYAELMAGIRVVIAENIERIYNENCQNLGVLTSTDFSLIERIRSGEEIELSAFTDGVDPITRDIIEYGGLFEYNVARLQGRVTVPAALAGRTAPASGTAASSRTSATRPRCATCAARREGRRARDVRLENAAAQTMATSRPTNEPAGGPSAATAVDADARRRRARARAARADDDRREDLRVALGRRCGGGRFGVPAVRPGDSGFVRTDWRFSHEYVSPMAAIFFEHKLGPDAKVNDPSTILMFRDHLTYLHEVMPPERVQLGLLDVARQLKDKQEEFAKKQGVIYYGERLGHAARLGGDLPLEDAGGVRGARGSSSSARTRTRRTPAPSAASRSASARRRSSTRGSRRTCASVCRRRSRSSCAAASRTT